MSERQFEDAYYESVKWRVTFRDNHYPRCEQERHVTFAEVDLARCYAKRKMECPERYSNVLLEEVKSIVTVRCVPLEEKKR